MAPDRKIAMSEGNAHMIIKKRIIAAWIDILLFSIPLAYIKHPIILAVYPLNYVFIAHFKGFTIGMFLMGIRIVSMSDTDSKANLFTLFLRSIYFYTIYLYQNIPTRGVVRINQYGQTKLDEKFNTTVVFKAAKWEAKSDTHIYESYLHHIIFFTVIFCFFVVLICGEIITNFIVRR
jgi:hypothetical protein